MLLFFYLPRNSTVCSIAKAQKAITNTNWQNSLSSKQTNLKTKIQFEYKIFDSRKKINIFFSNEFSFSLFFLSFFFFSKNKFIINYQSCNTCTHAWCWCTTRQNGNTTSWFRHFSVLELIVQQTFPQSNHLAMRSTTQSSNSYKKNNSCQSIAKCKAPFIFWTI